jgi:hypothetical protein
MHQPKFRRNRGVILTSQGWNKLQKAKSEAEFEENSGYRYTLEELSERTNLSVDTLHRVNTCSVTVDKQTLMRYFSTFNLKLEPDDYYRPGSQIKDVESDDVELELPEGQVPLGSVYYVERPPVESRACAAILQPGALIRIKGSKLMGKTSLMARILERARKQGYRTVILNFQLPDKKVFSNLDRFLQWFCACVSRSLGLPNQLDQCWDETFGSNDNTTYYFENYLLAQIDTSLVLALDNVDCVFPYSEIASDFFCLLRSWYEKAKYGDDSSHIWQKLRLVAVHSTEVYIPLNINQSPFNVGLSIELPELTSEQVLDLAKRYGLDWSTQTVEQLIALVGGHPHLVRLALYHIWAQDISWEQMLQTGATSGGIYNDHLKRQFWNLQKYPELMAAFETVVKASAPVELDLVPAFQLQSMGLVHLDGRLTTPSCKLYHQYFRDRLSSTLSHQVA